MAYLELNNVHKRFAAATAVEAFDLKVERAELVSFLGPSGCGKTTTLRMIAGFITPSSGAIVIDGVDVTNVPPNKRHVGMVFQSYALFPNMTVADNIGFGLKIAGKPAKEIEARAKEMLAIIHLDEMAARYPHQLSGGQQQRVALARALAFRPQVLLLDEPLSALDAKIRVTLRQEIRAIQQELAITAIYVTHDQEEALSMSDRIVVMNSGRIEQVGTPFEIYNYPRTQFVAQFVGTLNTLSAEVRDAAKGVLMIDQHLICAANLDGARNGDKVHVSIRPERISRFMEAQESNVLEAAVESIAFLGSIVRLRLNSGSNAFYMDTFNNPHLALPARGEKIKVAFPREAVLMLAGNPAVA